MTIQTKKEATALIVTITGRMDAVTARNMKRSSAN